MVGSRKKKKKELLGGEKPRRETIDFLLGGMRRPWKAEKCELRTAKRTNQTFKRGLRRKDKSHQTPLWFGVPSIKSHSDRERWKKRKSTAEKKQGVRPTVVNRSENQYQCYTG